MIVPLSDCRQAAASESDGGLGGLGLRVGASRGDAAGDSLAGSPGPPGLSSRLSRRRISESVAFRARVTSHCNLKSESAWVTVARAWPGQPQSLAVPPGSLPVTQAARSATGSRWARPLAASISHGPGRVPVTVTCHAQSQSPGPGHGDLWPAAAGAGGHGHRHGTNDPSHHPTR